MQWGSCLTALCQWCMLRQGFRVYDSCTLAACGQHPGLLVSCGEGCLKSRIVCLCFYLVADQLCPLHAISGMPDNDLLSAPLNCIQEHLVHGVAKSLFGQHKYGATITSGYSHVLQQHLVR